MVSHDMLGINFEDLHRQRFETGARMAKHIAGLTLEELSQSQSAPSDSYVQRLRRSVWRAEFAALSADPTEKYLPKNVAIPRRESIDEHLADPPEQNAEPTLLDGVEADITLTPRDRLAVVSRWLETRVNEKAYVTMAASKGPLTESMIESSITNGDSFKQVAENFGWPSADDAPVAPVLDYDDNEFLDHLFEQPSGTPSNEDEAKRDEYALNNFIQYLRSEPISDIKEARGQLERLSGLVPFVHRANVVAPEFFQAIRIAANSFTIAEQEAAKEVLGTDEGAVVLRGMHMAYQIMGRLVRSDDRPGMKASAHKQLTD